MTLCFCFTHLSVPSPPFSAFPTKCRAWNLGLELLKRRKPWCSVCSVRSVLFTICFVKSPWISKVDIVAPFFSWPQHVQSGSFKLKFHRFLRSSQLPQSAWGQQVNLIPWLMLLYSRSLSLTRPWRVPRSACQGHCLTNSRSRWSSWGVHGFPSNALNGPRRKLPLLIKDIKAKARLTWQLPKTVIRHQRSVESFFEDICRYSWPQTSETARAIFRNGLSRLWN